MLAAVVCVLGVTGVLTELAWSFSPRPLAQRALDNQNAVATGAVRSLLAVLAIVHLSFTMRSRSLRPQLAGLLLVGVVGLDLWSIVRRYWIFSAPAEQLYASDRIMQYLQKIPEPGRVLPIALGGLNTRQRDPYLGSGDGRGDGFMVHGIRSLFGYHGNEIGRYDELTGWDRPGWPSELLKNPNLWKLLNLQYLYTNQPVPPIAGAQLVVPEVMNAANNPTYLFRLSTENPMAWITPLAVMVPDTAILTTLRDTRFDVRRVALFDSTTRVPTQPIPAALPDSSPVNARVTTMEPGHIVVALDRPAPENSTLIVSENYYPGWRATVDGVAAPLDRVDYLLMGVGLKAGARNIELTFRSETYARGRLISILAALAMLLALGAGVALSRRPQPAA